MPFLAPAPNSPALPTVPAAWRAGARPGPNQLRPVGQAAATPPVRPSTCAVFYVRKTGSDTNGGSSASLTPDKQGTDGQTFGTTNFQAASGSFTQADVNKLIMIGTKARYRIVAVGSGTSITLSGSPTSGSGLTWKVGGAVQTIGAFLSTTNSPTGTILGGDTIYIGAGTYREVHTLGGTLPTFPLEITGDTSGAFTGDPGMVVMSAYLTDDRTAPSAGAVITVGTRQFLTLNRLVLVGGTNACLSYLANANNIIVNDCAFLSNSAGMVSGQGAFGLFANIQFNRCYFGPSCTLTFTLLTGTGGHYDCGVSFKNCVFVGVGGSTAITVTNSGTLTGKGGGIVVRGATVLGGNTFISTVASQISTAIPCQVYGSAFYGTSVAVSAGTSGQIVENSNFFTATSPRTNVGAGSLSIPGPNIAAGRYAPLIHFGQEALWGGMPRWPGEPMVGSPMLGFGVDNGGADLVGRPRPSGEYSTAQATPAVGALQRGNTAVTDTTPIGGGTTPIQITGPGFEDFYVPVPARPITVSCTVRYTGSPAVLSVLPNGTIDVEGVSVVEPTGVPNVNHTLTLPTFTPSAGGNMVIIRIRNPDPSGSSVLEVDDFLVSG